jgi:hypothetical protein
MDSEKEIIAVIGTPEGPRLTYKSILPPSKNIAQLISSLANEEGGHIILGITREAGKLTIHGLGNGFRAMDITHKALDLLTPAPKVSYGYVNYHDKQLFAISVEKSNAIVLAEGKKYSRSGAGAKEDNPEPLKLRTQANPNIKAINQSLDALKPASTSSKLKMIEHYFGVLKIMDDMGSFLYPENPALPTNVKEGKIMSRMLFSSIVDTFEAYLSDILYEIFLAKPETLKSKEQVSVEDVLNCSDMQDFIRFFAKEKLFKLQKGSISGFLKENRQISILKAIDEIKEKQIEDILQIRHLYAHRNGIIDEKFLKYYQGILKLGEEHLLSNDDCCKHILFLVEIADTVDRSAIQKYRLDSIQ